MDFICYGSARELIIYISSIIIAGVPTLAARRGIDWYITNIKNQEIKPFQYFRASSLITFTIFCLFLFAGIYGSHTAMTGICGFAPDPEGAHRDRTVIELQRQIEESKARLKHLQ